MRLEDLGLNSRLKSRISEQKIDPGEVGRVIAEHKERYIVRTVKGESEW